MSDNMIFLDFGSFSVYWYGVFIGLAVLLAGLVFALLRKYQQSSGFSQAMTVVLLCLPAALIGSRLFYCWFAKASFAGGMKEFLNPAAGGYALYGALLGILIVLVIDACVHHTSLPQMTDAAAPALAMAIAIGRFASITGSGDIGFQLPTPKNGPWPFIVWSASENAWILWVGYFEGIVAAVIFVFTLIYFLQNGRKSDKGMTSGGVTLLFMLTYGLSQSLLESMRNDSLFMITLGFVRISQIISIVMALTAFVIIAIQCFRTKKRRGLTALLCAVSAAALGLAVYCEFTMSAQAMKRNYIMMAVSLGLIMAVGLFLFFQSGGFMSSATDSTAVKSAEKAGNEAFDDFFDSLGGDAKADLKDDSRSKPGTVQPVAIVTSDWIPVTNAAPVQSRQAQPTSRPQQSMPASGQSRQAQPTSRPQQPMPAPVQSRQAQPTSRPQQPMPAPVQSRQAQPTSPPQQPMPASGQSRQAQTTSRPQQPMPASGQSRQAQATNRPQQTNAPSRFNRRH